MIMETPSPRACSVSSWCSRRRLLAAAGGWSLRSDDDDMHLDVSGSHCIQPAFAVGFGLMIIYVLDTISWERIAYLAAHVSCAMRQLGTLLERFWRRAGAQTVPSMTSVNVWPSDSQGQGKIDCLAARGEHHAGGRGRVAHHQASGTMLFYIAVRMMLGVTYIKRPPTSARALRGSGVANVPDGTGRSRRPSSRAIN
jgi:hypothetical protein